METSKNISMPDMQCEKNSRHMSQFRCHFGRLAKCWSALQLGTSIFPKVPYYVMEKVRPGSQERGPALLLGLCDLGPSSATREGCVTLGKSFFALPAG